MAFSANVLRTDLRTNAQLTAWLAYVSLVVVFVLDAVTPQQLSIEIAYEVSVVLAALGGSKSLIVRVLALTMLGDVLGCVADAMQAGSLDAIGIENRVISLISIFIVGALSLSIRSHAENSGRLAAESSRQRLDGTLVQAMDRFWTSLQPSRIAGAIAEEARLVFGAEQTIWCPNPSNEPLLTSVAPSSEALPFARPTAGSQGYAALLRLTVLGSIETLPADPSVRGLGDRKGTPYYLAIPIAGKTDRYGVLLVSAQTQVATPETLAAASQFALRALAAMQQTHLIEELRMRNKALAARQSVIEDLVEAISHDVRTPLIALSVTLKQALEGAFGPLPAQYTSVLTESRNSIDGIQQLAETLLLVARFEAETPRELAEPVLFQDIVREITSELSGLAEAQGLTVKTNVTGGDATVLGSRSDLRRAASNLLANAIRNTPRGGTIELSVTHEASTVELAVSDDGYGVEPSVRNSLFQRYSKAPGDGGGNGLGLYIVRRVAEESGGTARYAARVPHGSIFTISLPDAPLLAA
jgi:signal transduction histidine kinase